MHVGALMGRSRRGEKMPSESGAVSGARGAGWSCRGAASLGSRRRDGGCGCGRCRGKSGSPVVMVSFLRAGWQGLEGVMGGERGWEVWSVGWPGRAVGARSRHRAVHLLTEFRISLQRETDTDSQASGGSDSGDWIFTIREKDPKSLENGALQPSDLERNKVTLAPTTVRLHSPLQACSVGGRVGSLG